MSKLRHIYINIYALKFIFMHAIIYTKLFYCKSFCFHALSVRPICTVGMCFLRCYWLFIVVNLLLGFAIHHVTKHVEKKKKNQKSCTSITNDRFRCRCHQFIIVYTNNNFQTNGICVRRKSNGIDSCIKSVTVTYLSNHNAIKKSIEMST